MGRLAQKNHPMVDMEKHARWLVTKKHSPWLVMKNAPDVGSACSTKCTVGRPSGNVVDYINNITLRRAS